MSVWLVFVEGWQIECCGTPVTIGDVVDWRLRWLEPYAGHEPAVRNVDIFESAPLKPADSMAFSAGTLLRSGGLSAWWGQAAQDGPLRLRGYLAEDHHGDVPDEVPATTGTVRRIEVVTTTFTCDVPGGNIWRPVPDTSQRKVVTTSPKWFSDEFPSDHAGTQTSSDSQIGVLVSLEVADQRMSG